MNMVWENMQNGMAAGGWIVGLLVVLGLFLVVVGGIGYALTWAFGGDDETEDAHERKNHKSRDRKHQAGAGCGADAQ